MFDPAVKKSFAYLSLRAKQKISLLVLGQTFLAFLDLFGVALIGFIGALSVSGIKSEEPDTRLSVILDKAGIRDLSFQSQVAVLGAIAVISLVLRTLISSFLTRKALLFLANNSSRQSEEMINELLKRPRLFLDGQSTQETLWAVTSGIQTINLGVIGSTVTLLTESMLLAVLLIGLMFFNPIMAIITITIFGIVALVLYRAMHDKARRLGEEYARISIAGNELFLELFSAFREILVRNKVQAYAQSLVRLRGEVSINVARSAFMPLISKYVVEITMVVAALLISAFLFMFNNAQEGVAALALFLAASSRIAPSILRLQQGITQIRMALAEASKTFALENKIKEVSAEINWEISFEAPKEDFVPKVELKKLSFTYPTSQKSVINQIDLEIEAGTFVAIVGPSGGGKSTLADLILGISSPSTGEVYISGQKPYDAIRRWPGQISYVPQNILILNDDIESNIIFDIEKSQPDIGAFNFALDSSRSTTFVNEMPKKHKTPVGERGAQISGGQKQRIGLARALYTRPSLLILDEATSALDIETESLVSDALNLLHGKCTLIVIAHRLSTVRNADQVVYLDKGKILATGSFEKVRDLVPEFDRQAGIMGL